MTWDEPPEPDKETATFTVRCNVDLVITVHADVDAKDGQVAELVEEYLDSDSSIFEAHINGDIEVEDRTVD